MLNVQIGLHLWKTWMRIPIFDDDDDDDDVDVDMDINTA